MRLTRLALAAVLAGSAFAGVQSASALSAQACPSGYQGVVIENNGSYTSVCFNLVAVKPCTRGTGYDLWVGGKHVSGCVAAVTR